MTRNTTTSTSNNTTNIATNSTAIAMAMAMAGQIRPAIVSLSEDILEWNRTHCTYSGEVCVQGVRTEMKIAKEIFASGIWQGTAGIGKRGWKKRAAVRYVIEVLEVRRKFLLIKRSR
jgi:hypothetical protein